jgi:hypothetical protein
MGVVGGRGDGAIGFAPFPFPPAGVATSYSSVALGGLTTVFTGGRSPGVAGLATDEEAVGSLLAPIPPEGAAPPEMEGAPLPPVETGRDAGAAPFDPPALSGDCDPLGVAGVSIRDIIEILLELLDSIDQTLRRLFHLRLHSRAIGGDGGQPVGFALT